MLAAISTHWFTKGFSTESCLVCVTQNAGISIKPQAAATHPPPIRPSQHLQMDFIELSPSEGKKHCLAIVDMWSKMSRSVHSILTSLISTEENQVRTLVQGKCQRLFGSNLVPPKNWFAFPWAKSQGGAASLCHCKTSVRHCVRSRSTAFAPYGSLLDCLKNRHGPGGSL